MAAGAATAAASTPAVPPVTQSPARPAPAGDLFDEIFRRGAPIEKTLQTASASFVETSTSTLLKAPQIARGTVVARRPNQVRLVYDAPDARTLVISGQKMSLTWPSRKVQDTRDVGGMMRRAERFFVVTSPADLRKHFDITAVDADDRQGTWRVTFTPKRAQIREGVSRVHVWIDKTSLVLQALRMEYPGGDTRLMEFSDVRINPPVAADAFALAAPR